MNDRGTKFSRDNCDDRENQRNNGYQNHNGYEKSISPYALEACVQAEQQKNQELPKVMCSFIARTLNV